MQAEQVVDEGLTGVQQVGLTAAVGGGIEVLGARNSGGSNIGKICAGDELDPARSRSELTARRAP